MKTGERPSTASGSRRPGSAAVDFVLDGGSDELSPQIRAVRRIGAIAWPSFFAAAVATFVFFAIVDPADLAEISWPHVEVSRKLGYSIGFLMFWACTLGSSAFTALLLSARVRRACRECRDAGRARQP
jgi:hypothetical protein